jgi:transposase-like protein
MNNDKKRPGEKYTPQQMIDALIETNGMITLAARRLGCSSNTVRRYIRQYATVAAAQREAQERLGDQVELTLISMALGERDKTTGQYIREPNIAALIFLAKTKFKHRGFVERQEVTGAQGGEIIVKWANEYDSDEDKG